MLCSLSARSFIIVNVCSLPDDRTARARIRDEALRLFADHGPDAITVRQIAEAAAVSSSLVIRHYDSKDGLRAAVDDHVARAVETILAQVRSTARDGPVDPTTAAPSFVEAVVRSLPADSAIPAYLGRMLIAGGPVGSALFERLHEASRNALATLTEAGSAAAGPNPEVRAAFLLVNDLAVVLLRPRLTDVLGLDPLSPEGLKSWGTEVLSVYRGGLEDTGVDHS